MKLPFSCMFSHKHILSKVPASFPGDLSFCIIGAAGRDGPAGSVKLYSEAAFHEADTGLPGMDAVFSLEVMARSGDDLQGSADEKTGSLL